MQTATLRITAENGSFTLAGTIDGAPIPPQSFPSIQELDDALDQLIGASPDDDESDDSQASGDSPDADSAASAPGDSAPSDGVAAQPATRQSPQPQARSSAVQTHQQMWDAEAAQRSARNKARLTNLT